MKPRITLAISLLWLAPALADRACYNLDGSQAADDVPCQSSGTTNCCNSNDLCMSNGLCYMQGWRGLALSRGSCTDKNWGAKCYAPCSNYNRNSGYPIVSIGFNGNSTKYCCGSVAWDNGSQTCQNDDNSFTLEDGTAMPGVAALANLEETNSSSTSTTSSNQASSTSSSDSSQSSNQPDNSNQSNSSRDAAIGAGVGVPLGVIALALIGWALWERRGRKNALAQGPSMQVAQGSTPTIYEQAYRHPLVELNGNGTSISELGVGNHHKPPEFQ